MPSGPTSAYACSCLNVRITATPTTNSPPPCSVDFVPVYVGDEGISIRHLQLTARVRSRSAAVSRNRRTRCTSVTCLVCQVLAYRVHQVIPLDGDSRDGPLLPTEDWVEQDVLKSSTGWIEVHQQCLTGDDISRIETSSEYSPLFSVAVQVPPVSPSVPQQEQPTRAYLEHLSPLFLPPPFTPGNSAFAHLSSIAEVQSDSWRSTAEDEIAAFIRAKTEELLRSEAVLRRQVETIYTRFREGMQNVQQADSMALASPRSPTSGSGIGTPSSPTSSGAADYGFTPMPVASVRQNLPTSMSALSASLVASGMHYPRAQQHQQEPTSPVSTLLDSLAGSSPTLTANSVSQPQLPGRAFDGEANLLDIPRRMDENMNTAASYRYFQIEEEMARKRAAEEARNSVAPAVQQPPSTAVAGPSSVNGRGNTVAESSTNGQVPKTNGKGKKKMVTFQSQPAVVTIPEKEEETRRITNDGDEMMFDLDTDNKESEVTEGTVMTLIEGPPQPRPSQPRRTSGNNKPLKDSAGLPQSFAALRPASLPLLSHMKPRRSPLRPLNDLPDVSQRQNEGSDDDDDNLDGQDYDSRDREILRLVAAGLPSHRHAWKKGSSEWTAFVSNRSEQLSDEEDFDAPAPPAMVGSMPIAIRTLGRPPVRLSTASYQNEASVRREEVSNTAPSTSHRNNMYAERDIHRAIDPGALDFAVDNQVIVEEDETQPINGADETNQNSISTARDRALRILQARSELPDPSMFYSLAS
ncbi:SET domain-containing protein [Mycena indigotica]|uniref:SET domain-containing protein n=1 Tax=Mycena indigotica TaxID=2126181 RepID=A0A8H6SQG6_9AGAR|nr:SET domain-containing protein [Mycena indigotica]KAF7302095.1 SET domain-containing protein [Mycena indigotica]